MNSETLLETIRNERGYTLSYHEILYLTEPTILERYSELYRALTLTPRVLSEQTREIVWCAILVLASEEIGTLHLERAAEAGVSTEVVASAVAVASLTACAEPLQFADAHWAAWLPEEWRNSVFEKLVATAADGLDERQVALVVLVSFASRQNKAGFLGALFECYEAGISEVEIAEALSYLLLPRGANAFLWATDSWLTASRGDGFKKFDALAAANPVTRRS